MLACGTTPEQKAEMTATAMTATAASWTATPTATSTATRTPTPTPTETPTPTATPTVTVTPSPTLDPDRIYSDDGLYSFVPPDGWDWDTAGFAGMAMLTPPYSATDDTAFVLFMNVEIDFELAFDSAMFQDTVINALDRYEPISEDFPDGDSGDTYFRWEYEGTKDGTTTHNIVYMFSDGENLVVANYTRAPGSDEDTDALIDASMQTLRFEEP